MSMNIASEKIICSELFDHPRHKVVRLTECDNDKLSTIKSPDSLVELCEQVNEIRILFQRCNQIR